MSRHTPEWRAIAAPHAPVGPVVGRIFVEADCSLWFEYETADGARYAFRTDGVRRQWYKREEVSP